MEPCKQVLAVGGCLLWLLVLAALAVYVIFG